MVLLKQNRGGTGMGVAVGIVSTILVLAVIFGVTMFAMGRCPLCDMMNSDQSNMMQNDN